MYASKMMRAIAPSPTLSIDAKFKAMLAEGQDIVGFGAGEPDFDTPEHIKEAAIAAILNGQTRYTPAAGTPALRKAICDKFERENGLHYEPSNIVVSNGAKHSLVNVFRTILNAGDEAIVPSPYWVSYPEIIKIAHGVPKILETTEETCFKFTPEMLENAITEKTHALVLNSPSNPTGMIYSREELEKIAEVCLKHDLYVVSDEIYERLVYDEEDEHVSIASLSEEMKKHTIVVNGVSKSYAMTGWRIGYTACEEEIAKIMANVQSHATSNPCSISQAATLAALTQVERSEDTIEAMRAEFRARRDYMVKRINKVPHISCIKPQGAFYVMMNIKKVLGTEIQGKVINNSEEFCDWALEKAKVALVPGSGFGAEGYVRWSYATSMGNIEKGIERIEKFLSK